MVQLLPLLLPAQTSTDSIFQTPFLRITKLPEGITDIEADQEIAEQAGVSGTPTIQLFHHKSMVNQWRGVKQRSEFKAAIEACLKNAA